MRIENFKLGYQTTSLYFSLFFVVLRNIADLL
jgi:ABC-type thiamin/hydroxymethylpyrimidine transport system permease subunit